MDKKWLIGVPLIGLILYGIYRVSQKPGGGGNGGENQVVLNMQPSEGGTTNPGPGDHSYNYGEWVTLTATPNEGYTFVNWSGYSNSGEIQATAENPYTFMMNQNFSLKANFSPSGDGGGDGGGGDGGPGAVTVHLKASAYDADAKYWVVLSRTIVQAMPVPIDQEIVLTIPADDFASPTGFVLVDMFTGDPVYGGGVSLRDSYPNLGFGLSTARNLVNGEILTWIAKPNGWWQDTAGQWV